MSGDRSAHCWMCGRPRGLEVKRRNWGLDMGTVSVPRTDNPDDRPSQISNDFMVHAFVERNGGSTNETHVCNDCLRIALRAMKTRISEALGELDADHDAQSELVRLTERLANTQSALQRLAHDHNRMQDRLKYVLSKVPPEAFKGNDELDNAKWEVRRGKAREVYP